MQKTAFGPIILGLGFALLLPAVSAQAQATRTWVSGVGDDVNPCSRTAPCKTFAGAISKTAAGGEINCLDPAGYGAVTITKSMTIDCRYTHGSILAAGSSGVIVNAGTGDIVTLRGLSLNGVGTGLIGVNFIGGRGLIVEDSKIFGFRSGSAIGIKFAPPTGVPGRMLVLNTTIHDSGTSGSNGGIVVQPVGTGSANVELNNVHITGSTGGILVNGSGSTGGIEVLIRQSTVSNNGNDGISAATPVGGAAVNMMIDGSAAQSNAGTGIVSSGTGVVVRMNNTSVVGNTQGLTALSGGLLQSYKNNPTDGNGSLGTTPTQIFPN